MSIIKAVDRAYRVMRERKWNTVYWCIDLHDTCLKANYQNGGYEWINDQCVQTLRLIADRVESEIILWSSAYPKQQEEIVDFFCDHGIPVLAFNENPMEANTVTGDFSKKFYFSVLIDDKAGFDPAEDWYKLWCYIHQLNVSERE